MCQTNPPVTTKPLTTVIRTTGLHVVANGNQLVTIDLSRCVMVGINAGNATHVYSELPSFEPTDSLFETLLQFYRGFPSERPVRQGDIRTSLGWIILG